MKIAETGDQAVRRIEADPSVNVLGEPLEPCSADPITGFFRNGSCDTCPEDQGSHTVCAVMTADFLVFSRSVGNDLSTPHPQFGFEGLSPGDQWCLCAARLLQAYQAGRAPRIRLRSTHRRALEIVPLNVLRELAVERN
jgi:uncharacterized protein